MPALVPVTAQRVHPMPVRTVPPAPLRPVRPELMPLSPLPPLSPMSPPSPMPRGGKCWIQPNNDFTLLRAQLCCAELTDEQPPNKGFEKTVENMLTAAADRNDQAANGTGATIGASNETTISKAIAKLNASQYDFSITMLGRTYFRVTAESTNELLKLNDIIGDDECRIQREKKVSESAMQGLKEVKEKKDKSYAEAASRLQEKKELMKQRMEKKAEAAAKKARSTPEFTALMESAAATYREMKQDKMEELAEDEAIEMVDK